MSHIPGDPVGHPGIPCACVRTRGGARECGTHKSFRHVDPVLLADGDGGGDAARVGGDAGVVAPRPVPPTHVTVQSWTMCFILDVFGSSLGPVPD